MSAGRSPSTIHAWPIESKGRTACVGSPVRPPTHLTSPTRINSLDAIAPRHGGRFYLLSNDVSQSERLVQLGAQQGTDGLFVEARTDPNLEALDLYLPQVARRIASPFWIEMLPASSWADAACTVRFDTTGLIVKRALLLVMSLLFAQSAPAAGPTQWTWEAGKQTSNGSITVKSVNGGTTYSGTQNPTGAVAKTNQSAVTQPPTVIIQATGGGGGACAAVTRTIYNGNLGGRAGADAKCAAEFGAGWRFSTTLEVGSCARAGDVAQPAPWVDQYIGDSNNNNCQAYTSSVPTANGAILGMNAQSTWSFGAGQGCSSARPIVCVKMQ